MLKLDVSFNKIYVTLVNYGNLLHINKVFRPVCYVSLYPRVFVSVSPKSSRSMVMFSYDL